MKANQIHILFFASLREAVGCAELVQPLSEACQAADLLTMLANRKELAAVDFAERNLLVAINQQLAGWQDWVTPGDEVAFFPPVTGG